MAYFPMFVDIEGKKVVIIGGGKVAKRKAEVLISFGAEVLVIAKEIKEKFDCEIINREYRLEDLKNAFIVVAATDNRNVNNEIANHCKSKDIHVNVVDSKEDSSFIFGATIVDDRYTIGVGTNGNSPKLAKELKDNIRMFLDGCDHND